MFRRHDQEQEPAPVGPVRNEPDTALRDQVDPDRLVEEATARLRDQLQSLDAVDAWGRPLAWRQVARIALGSLASPRVRDALTADVLADAVTQDVPDAGEVRSVSPDATDRTTEWRTFFRAIDQTDRLLRDQSGVLPER
jgi:hypothetical protein